MGSPVTNIIVVSEKYNCPPSYTILSKTQEGEDADFWKDKLFKSKVTRYVCYTTDEILQNQPCVVTDLALVGLKDPIPSGYTAVKETADTKEQALRKHLLCVRFTAKNSTNSAISEIGLWKTNVYRSQMHTLVGEANGINLTYKLSQIPLEIRKAPPPPVNTANAPTLMSANTVPANNYGHNSLQRSSSHCPTSVIEGIPFKLHDRLVKNQSNANIEIPDLKIKSLNLLKEETFYDFSQEHTIIQTVS